MVKSNGFSLIEVLIAVFIFAVGLLGVAGLQLFAKQNNFDAIQRTAAALLASEIAEKMRANPSSAHMYISNVPDIANATDLPTTECTISSQCTSDDLAYSDLRLWYEAILGSSKENSDGEAIGGLVSPSACITPITETTASGTATVGYNIAIAWRGKAPLANPTSSTCGEDESVYGAGNTYRRVIVFAIAL